MLGLERRALKQHYRTLPTPFKGSALSAKLRKLGNQEAASATLSPRIGRTSSSPGMTAVGSNWAIVRSQGWWRLKCLHCSHHLTQSMS